MILAVGGALNLPCPEPTMNAFAPAPTRFTDAEIARAFMLAGNATVTLRSVATGTRYTYKLQAPKDDGPARFAKLLVGSNNETDYEYVGMVGADGVLRATRATGPRAASTPFKALEWSLRKLAAGELPDSLEVWHEGRCGRCGRKLTVPASIESGFGPECAQRR